MRQAAEPAAGRAGGRRIIERPRLIKLLEGTTARTILLIAPAGYGKTTLARQWAERQENVHWYTARTGSADVAQLAVDLAAVLDDRPPQLKEYVSQLVRARSSPTQQVSEIVEGFASAVGDANSVSLFIDDYHVIAEEEVSEWFVHELQSRLGFRLFLASRSRPSWATARLQIYGETVEFGAEELALTDAEAADVLGASAHPKGLLAQARGWPAVVGLAAKTAVGTSPPDAGAPTLFRFFAEELFLATPTNMQEKLITLALLPTLSAPLIERALGGDGREVIDDAIGSGLASHGPDGPELHPLVREYLLTKLRGQSDASPRIGAALDVCLESGHWDHGFELIERFAIFDLLHELIERSFKPLLGSGRIATLERIADYAHASNWDGSPLIALIDAELAFRAGAFSRSEALAIRVAEALGSSHRLTSHAWWIAGHAAQLSFQNEKASRHFAQARNSAQDDEDGTDALWGLTMTLAQAEEPTLTEVLAQFTQRRGQSAVELVRSTQAELLARRATSLNQPVDIDGALHALQALTDPRVKTSFMNTYAYHLILSARYEDAFAVASQMREVADAYRLEWAQPHAHWALAASSLGLRQFRKAEGWLRRVEISADELRDGHLLLNAACLRARLLLALQRPPDAQNALAVDETHPTSRAMRGEFLATKALVAAATGQPLEACTILAEEATTITSCVEARAYAACARAIALQSSSGRQKDVIQNVRDVANLGAWDAIVSTLRADPAVLRTVAQAGEVDSFLAHALRSSADHDLARKAGVDLGRRARIGDQGSVLSRREREVLELVKQGLTNREIAKALFLSQATVKVHVRHILDKTGSRTRTEAATSTDFEA